MFGYPQKRPADPYVDKYHHPYHFGSVRKSEKQTLPPLEGPWLGEGRKMSYKYHMGPLVGARKRQKAFGYRRPYGSSVGGGYGGVYKKRNRYPGISYKSSIKVGGVDYAANNMRTGGFMGLELRFLDRNRTATTCGSNADLTGGEKDPSTVNCLNSMAQGTGESTRLGRAIVMHTIKVKGIIAFPLVESQVFPSTTPLIAIYLILDMQTNGAQLSSEDIFTNKNASVPLLTSLFMNMENTDRFKVLDSQHIRLEPNVVNEGGINLFAHGKIEVPFTLGKNLRKMTTLYKSTGGNISDIRDNSIHIVAFATNASVTIEYNSRLRFTTS